MKQLLKTILLSLAILVSNPQHCKADGGMTITNLTTSTYVGCAVVYCVTDTNNITTAVGYVSLAGISPNGGVGMLDIDNTTIPGFDFTMQQSLTNEYTVVAHPYVALLDQVYCDFNETGYEIVGGSSSTVSGDVFFTIDNSCGAEVVFDYCGTQSCSLKNKSEDMLFEIEKAFTLDCDISRSRIAIQNTAASSKFC